MLYFPSNENYANMIRFQFCSGIESDRVAAKLVRKHSIRRISNVAAAIGTQSITSALRVLSRPNTPENSNSAQGCRFIHTEVLIT